MSKTRLDEEALAAASTLTLSRPSSPARPKLMMRIRMPVTTDDDDVEPPEACVESSRDVMLALG
jgi:hypothetical protein